MGFSEILGRVYALDIIGVVLLVAAVIILG